MRINEVESISNPVARPDQLMGLVQFLNGRADDTGAQKKISQQTFISLAQSLGINVTPSNIADVVGQPPLDQMLEPLDPNTGEILFKGAGVGPTHMPVNRAQDIVAGAAKKAMNKDRGV